MDDFREIEEYEEEEEFEERRPFWKRALISTGRVFVGIIVLISVFYIYSGFRQLFFYRETPAEVNQLPTEVKIDAEVMTMPLNILVLRNEGGGSLRNEESIRSLVDNASKVWNQGAIDFEIFAIEEVKVSGLEIDSFLDNPQRFIREMEEYDSEMVNVLLTRRLEGLNGIAFPGMGALSVADLTTVYDFRVLAHEIGHILRLGHVPDKSLLMHGEANSFELTLEEINTARRSDLFN